MKALSLFANVGIAETYLDQVGITTVLANELLPQRVAFYRYLYPNVDMIEGDITNPSVFQQVMEKARQKGVDFILATPPCQGMSLAGKRAEFDPRNQLIDYAVQGILDINPKYAMLENVPQQLKTQLCYQGELMYIPQYLQRRLGKKYHFAQSSLVSAKDYGVAQTRKRNIILLTRRDQKIRWEMPAPLADIITLREALEAVPSLNPMLTEGLEETMALFPDFQEKKQVAQNLSPWHKPPSHSKKLVITMQHTPSGCSAFDNPVYFPKKNDGNRVKGHSNQYRRHSWDSPCRTITQNSAVISSLCCVHPGHLLENQLYSDPRCLSIYELMLVTSLPKNWNIPPWAKDKLIRSVIGEGIPPLLVKNIIAPLMKAIKEGENE